MAPTARRNSLKRERRLCEELANANLIQPLSKTTPRDLQSVLSKAKLRLIDIQSCKLIGKYLERVSKLMGDADHEFIVTDQQPQSPSSTTSSPPAELKSPPGAAAAPLNHSSPQPVPVVEPSQFTPTSLSTAELLEEAWLSLNAPAV
jgi:hypothetical protein